MHDPAEILRRRIRTVPDWPQQGVMFRDITPLLQDAEAFRMLIELFVARYLHTEIDLVAAIDARGFIVGGALAYALGAGLVPVRKSGKLPFTSLAESYALEYGSATVEIHADACQTGARILLVDDLVATGGTMLAAARLLGRLGAHVVETAAIIDLPALGGSSRLRAAELPLFAVCEF